VNAAKDPSQRVLLAAGTQTHSHSDTFADGLENLNGVPGELRSMVDSLTWLGYEPQPGSGGLFLLDPDVKGLRAAIRSVVQEAPVVLVYYTGHGIKPAGHPYYLLTSDSEGNDLEGTALEARKVLTLLLREDLPSDVQPQVLVILDCCYSGAGGIDVLRDSLQDLGNPNVWVMAAATDEQQAAQGLFAQAFTAALAEPNAGHVAEFIHPQRIAEQVNAALAGSGADQGAILVPPRGQLLGPPPPFFPNPDKIVEAAGLTLTEQRQWHNRLRAAPEGETATGSYVTGFLGRVRAVEDVAAWMRGPDDHGLAVVTGSPGTGKSTLLALPVLLADPDRAAALLADSPADSLPARAAKLFNGLPFLGLSARGKTPYEVARTVADRLGRTAGFSAPEDLLEHLAEEPEGTPQIILIDAIDEAVESGRLMTDLVLPLSRNLRMKVLIGTRRHLMPPPGVTALLVDLDSEDYRDPQALLEYVRQLLLAANEPGVNTPYRDAPEEVTAAVADAIAGRATAAPSITGRAESFLLAQLLAKTVRSRQQVLDPSAPGWADRLPADVGEAFDEDLARLGMRERKVRALLTALAWTQGPGLPWENIWVPVARALTVEEGPPIRALADTDVRWLLDNAGGYIIEDLGPGLTSAFRPFHELLAVHLRGEPDREKLLANPATAQAWLARSQQAEAAITRTLLDTVPTAHGGDRDWELAHPYLRTYLARHAHAAGPETFTQLVADPDYLAVADPATLTPLLTPIDPALRETSRAYRRARPLLGTNPGDNAAYLQESFVAETGHPPERQHIRPTYRTLITRTRHDNSLLTLTAHTKQIESVAFGTRADGRLILATGGNDGAVRLWDPDTGTENAGPLDHGGPVAAVAVGTREDGRLLIVSAGGGAVRLWDPDAGIEPRGPLDRGKVAFGTRTDGRLLLATASDLNGTVRLWDPNAGIEPAGSLDHGGPVTSVAFGTRTDGRLLLATAGNRPGTVRLSDTNTGTEPAGNLESTVRLWDPDTGAEPAGHLDHGERVESVAFGNRADGRLLLASAGIHGTVRLWDPDTGTEACKPLRHGGGVPSIAFGTRDGVLLLVSGGDDGTVRLWDPDTGTENAGPLDHGGPVAAVAVGTREDGRLLIVSAGGGAVRLWDPDACTEPRGSLDHGGPVAAVASVAFGTRTDGRLLLATAGRNLDGTVRLWDPNAGTEPAGHLHHGGPVTSVAFGTGTDGRLLLATGGYDGLVRLWDPDTGTEPAGHLHHGERVESVAFGNRADGRLLLASAGLNGTVRLWDPDTGTEACKPLRHANPVELIAVANGADGRLLLASAGWEFTVRLWDPVSGTEVGGPLDHGSFVESVAFGTREDGRLLLATGGYDGLVRLWDPVSGTEARGPLGHGGGVASSVAFGTGADGRLLLATGGFSSLRLWDAAAGTICTTLRRRTPVRSVALHDTLLAIGDDEGLTVVDISYAT
jgi:WD40 repeat protein